MKKLLFLLLAPLFVTPTVIVSSDLEADFLPDEITDLTYGVAEKLDFYQELPKNPVLVQDTVLYQDAELEEFASLMPQKDQLQIVSLALNQQGIPVFKLKNGTFLAASRQVVYDDIVLSSQAIDLEGWVLESVETYDKPFVKGAVFAKNKLKPFDKVRITEEAITGAGRYLKVEGYGWISDSFVTTDDLSMKKVQQLLDTKYNKDNLSVYVKSLVTDDMAEINADKMVYAASVAKLPILYYAQEKLNQGKASLGQALKYDEATLKFDGAYDTAGSGLMSKVPDNKDYSVESILKAIAQNSDNAASNVGAYYLADKFDGHFYKKMQAILGQKWDMVEREANVRMAGKMMEAIYYQNGDIVDYLSKTSFDGERIAKDIPVPVAHKIGDAYDFRHDVAIVFADQPFILAIFTENMTYDDISTIANEIYAILK